MNISTEQLSSTRGKAASRLSGILHEQPLIIAALGVAVGAAIGAALPMTAVEDDWMGNASSSVKHAARDAAQSEIDGFKAMVSGTAENVKQGASDHGPAAENLNDFVKDVGASSGA